MRRPSRCRRRSDQLKYVVRSGGQVSEVYTETYDLRSGLATVTAAPGPAMAPAVLEGRQDVVLKSSRARSDLLHHRRHPAADQ